MLKNILCICVVWINILQGNADMPSWTEIYHVRNNEIMRMANHNKKTLFYEKNEVQPFTQLIFSWNALRPKQGYFSFYVQVRDPETKKWGIWHHMADWGTDIQKSYVSKSDGFSSFFHVRLEIDNKKVADAFRIKIIPHDEALLSLVYNYSIAVSDFNVFKAEKVINDTLESVHIKGLPFIAQFALEHEDNGRICSPVSSCMLVSFLKNEYLEPLEFAKKSFDSGLSVYGSWPYNMAHAFEECDGKIPFFVRRMNSFTDVHQKLLKGIPVVVSVRGTLPGALKPFPHGHLLVIVGWDNETREILCHDPAAENDEKVFKRYSISDFLRAWEQSYRLAYIAEPNT